MKLKSTSDAWESGELGRNEKYVKKSNVNNLTLDEELDLQMISVRLNKALIEDLKTFAKIEGLEYKPLMRRILTRWVEREKTRIDFDIDQPWYG